jgi:hypothetical protein
MTEPKSAEDSLAVDLELEVHRRLKLIWLASANRCG